ncbi:MAG: 16S rRNA (uracil(1498)-N(3))-methyltransferase [Candidatus Obscuribacterales bacterium]|nr:16S rRNA (uracil(1498)-N(3))-methyltransferase [Candidatus Obscuribacterales bacterium]
MTRHRFLIGRSLLETSAVTSRVLIEDKQRVKQIRKVLRLKTGHFVDLLDNEGNLFTARLATIDTDSVEAFITERHREPQRIRPSLTVFMPILKKTDRFEWALQKLTELGVDEIRPVYAERSIVRPGNTPEPRMDRWMSITTEATEQSERYRTPRIYAPAPLEEILISSSQSRLSRCSFICAERSKSPHLVRLIYDASDNFAPSPVSASNISIFIGPEGGFSDTEIEIARESGITLCSLGKTILRSETAAVVAAGLIVATTEYLW